MCDLEKKKAWLSRYRKNKLIIKSEQELIDEHIKMYQENQQIIKAINSVDNPLYKALLIRRYINGETNEEISKNMNYEERHVRRLLKKSIESINMSLNVRND
jgi:DNA-directed RNA polymerase specialized sigma24 family protein